MKLLITTILSSLIILSFGQNNDVNTKLNILKKVFSDYKVTSYEDEKVFETKVWETHATIPFKDCYVAYFENGNLALAFNIYLSEDPNQYRFMVEEGIGNMIDVDDTNSFQGGDQRLIQVIYYDTKNDKFLGKAVGFPLKGFTWVPEGMGDVTTLNIIRDFNMSEVSNNTCI